MAQSVIMALAGAGVLLGCAAAYTDWAGRRIAARFPPAGAFAEAEGLRLHLTETRPSGPAKAVLLLIHGASGNEAEMRSALAASLVASNYRVIAIDRPGHGWSERHPDPASNDPAGQARLIRRALESYGVRSAIPVVHSLAGALGLQLALDHADFARGAVLISPVTHPWPGGIAAYYSLAASPIGGLFTRTLALPAGQALLDNALASVFAPHPAPSGYLAQTGVELVLRPAAFRANASDVAHLYDFVARESARYGHIRIPVAIVAGSVDTIVLTDIHSRQSAKAIPGADLTILDGVGHVPHWTHPQSIVAAVERVHARAAAATNSLR